MDLTAMAAAITVFSSWHEKRPGKGQEKDPQPLTAKLLKVMKLTSVLILAGSLHLAAAGNAQRVNLKLTNVSLKTVFIELNKQTGYNFLYSDEVLAGAKPVSIIVEKATIEEVLTLCFKDQPLTYSIQNKVIILKRKTPGLHAEDPLLTPPPPIDVHGRLINEKGEALEGVTVTVKGSRRATFTDANGEFSLKNVKENSRLVFSGVNVETFELAVNNRSLLGDIALKTKITAMGDVTVSASTGFQTISRERSTGSYAVISREQLEKPSTNIAQRLIGTTAGVQSKLDVNGNPIFEIRGLSSLYGNAQPLVVVDGFPIQGDFNTVNPNDVESITILKDAAAASIWGARSANGVIVIVTKKVKKGTPLRVDFSVFTRIGKKFDLDYVRPLASSAETVEYEKLAYANWRGFHNPNSLQDYFIAYSQAGTALNEANLGYISQSERDARLEALKLLDNRRQISDYLLSNPVSTQYNLNLSGASAKMSNFLSLMYQDNQSNFKETSNRQYLLNYRNSAEVFKWMDFDFSGMVNFDKGKNSGVSLPDIQNMSPYDMLVNADDSFTDINTKYTPILHRLVPMDKFPYTDWTYNPIREIQNRDLSTEQLNSRIQAGLRFKIIKGLTINVQGQYELFNSFNQGLYNENTYFVRNSVNTATYWNRGVTPNTFTLNLPKGGILTQGRSKIQSYNLRGQLNYNKIFLDKHEINFLAGTEVNNIKIETYSYPTAYGYNDKTLSVGNFPNGPGGNFSPIRNWLGNTQTFPYTNRFTYGTEKYFSVYANAAYTYNRKYTLSGSYRTDASNLITDDPAYRYAPFWSAGIGWQIYREDFMRNVPWIDRLNVRATYGYNGNVDRSTSFQPLITLGGTPQPTGDFGAAITSFGNPTLRWEKTGTWNFGLDYSIFNNRLFGKVDIYNKYGKDLIARLSIPAINGTTSQKLNNAEMTNKGIEMELGTQLNINKNISWMGNLNFSYNQNKITKLFVANYTAFGLMLGGTFAYVEGEDANSLWKFEYAGIVNNQPNVVGDKGATYDFGSFTPGDGRDYLINTGTRVAPYTLGFMNAFQIYDFNLSFIVTGKFGHKFQRMGFNYPATHTTRVLPNNKLSEVMNGDPSKMVPLPYNPNDTRYSSWIGYSQYLSYLVESASHIRMQEVNLSYGLPLNSLKKFNMARLMVYAQGNDLFTLYANDAKEDPEYPLGTMNPRPKLTLGFKCEF